SADKSPPPVRPVPALIFLDDCTAESALANALLAALGKSIVRLAERLPPPVNEPVPVMVIDWLALVFKASVTAFWLITFAVLLPVLWVTDAVAALPSPRSLRTSAAVLRPRIVRPIAPLAPLYQASMACRTRWAVHARLVVAVPASASA